MTVVSDDFGPALKNKDHDSTAISRPNDGAPNSHHNAGAGSDRLDQFWIARYPSVIRERPKSRRLDLALSRSILEERAPRTFRGSLTVH